jgi:hypothetical protein
VDPSEALTACVESYRGFAGVRAFWGEFLSTWDSYRVELLNVY